MNERTNGQTDLCIELRYAQLNMHANVNHQPSDRDWLFRDQSLSMRFEAVLEEVEGGAAATCWLRDSL